VDAQCCVDTAAALLVVNSALAFSNNFNNYGILKRNSNKLYESRLYFSVKFVSNAGLLFMGIAFKTRGF
jgi:hypothetical protein